MKAKTVRIGVYLSEPEYRALRSLLALSGMSASAWIRREIHAFIAQSTPPKRKSQ